MVSSEERWEDMLRNFQSLAVTTHCEAEQKLGMSEGRKSWLG